MVCVLALFLLSSILVIFPSAYASSRVSTFSAALNLSNDHGQAIDPAVSNYLSKVYVAWSEGSGGILFRASNNSGVTWNPPLSSEAKKISTGSGGVQFPVMFTQYQNTSDVLVSWAQEVSGEGLQVFAASSSNGGSSFNTVQLSPEIKNGTAITPAVAGWGSTLYVSWYEQGGCLGNAYNGSGCIMVTSSTNNGATWRPYTELNPSGDGEEEVTAAGKAAYVIADGIWFSNTTNRGKSWSAPANLYHVTYSHTSINYGREPWVAVFGKDVYTVWEANSTKSKSIGYQAIGRDSTNGGITWTGNITINQSIMNDWQPQNAAFGNNSFTTFHSLANQGIYMTSAINSGANWSAPVLVSKTGLTSAYAHIFTSDGDNIFVMWGQQVKSGSSTWNAYVSYSRNAGTSWSSPIDISNNSGGVAAGNNDVTLFAVSSYGKNCYAAWTYTSGSASQIYFASS